MSSDDNHDADDEDRGGGGIATAAKAALLGDKFARAFLLIDHGPRPKTSYTRSRFLFLAPSRFSFCPSVSVRRDRERKIKKKKEVRGDT